MQNNAPPVLELPGLDVSIMPASTPPARWDLHVILAEVPGAPGLHGSLVAAADIFDLPAAEMVAHRLARVVAAVVADPSARVSKIEILAAGELRQILAGGNDTAAPAGLHELVGAHAARSPDAVAVVCGEAALTYAGLHGRAARLARYLRDAGAGPETVVGLRLDCDADMIVAILAVWQTGAAYLALAPGCPAERLTFMLSDSRVTVVLGNAGATEDLPLGRVRVVAVDAGEVAAAAAVTAAGPPAVTVRPDQLAYVMYTSGSPGTPEGVQVTHGNLMAYVAGLPGRTGLGEPGRRYGLLPGPVTDLGHTMIFTSLATGGVLHVLSREMITDPDAVAGYLADHSIDYLKIVPSHLAALAAAGGLARLVPARVLVLGGETVAPGLAGELLAVAGDRAVVNHYGPAEATIGVAAISLTGADLDGGRVPIGLPVPGTRLYVVDARLNLVPLGVPGELVVGGAQVARGYRRRAALTAERFIADPFSADGSRLYRTGDRARWRPDGVLELLGRIDDRVKNRGHRAGPGVAGSGASRRL